MIHRVVDTVVGHTNYDIDHKEAIRAATAFHQELERPGFARHALRVKIPESACQAVIWASTMLAVGTFLSTGEFFSSGKIMLGSFEYDLERANC